MKRVLYLLTALTLLMLISGCGIKIVAPYSPSILMDGKGELAVDKFIYVPAVESKKEYEREISKNKDVYVKVIGQNEVDTGRGFNPVYTNEDVDQLITTAFMKEAKFIGYHLNQSSNIIVGGDILEFSCDYIGLSTVDFLTKIKFKLYDNSNGEKKLIYEKVHEGKESLSKFQTEGLTGLYTSLAKTIESFIKDAQKEKLL